MTDEQRGWPERVSLSPDAYWSGEVTVTNFKQDDELVIMCGEKKDGWVSGQPETIPA